jgi:hypothetical protein
MTRERMFVKNHGWSVTLLIIAGLLICGCDGLSILAPDSPAAFAVNVNAQNDPELKWTNPAGNVKVIVIERKKISREKYNHQVEQFNGGFEEIARLESPASGYVDQTAIGGVTYRYRIAAENSAGRSGYTDEQGVTLASESVFSIRRQGTSDDIPNGGAVSLGDVAVYGTTFLFTIENKGASLLFFSVPSVSPAEFSLIIDWYEREPGESAQLLIVPLAGLPFQGFHSVLMTFQTNDPAQPTFSLTITWTAT